MQIIKFLVIATIVICNIKAIYAKDTWHYGVKSNDTIIAQISEKEISRINLRGEVIERLHFIEGEIEFTKEEEDLYLKPIVTKPINMFLKTEAGNTYKILLEVVDVPACQIFITKKPKPKQIFIGQKQLANSSLPQNVNKKAKLPAKEQTDSSPASFEEKRISKIINILEIEDEYFGIKLQKASGKERHKKYQITKKMTGTGSGLYAEKYEIKNITHDTQTPREEEFMTDKTKAVYLSQEKLLPEQTAVLIKVYKK